MKTTYLLVDILVIFFPLAFSFEKRIAFYKKWKYLFPAQLITGLIFLIWDGIFTRYGIWSFSYKYTIGLRLFYLPLEEWLFFISVPYACVFVYEFSSFLGHFTSKSRVIIRWSFLVIAIILICIAGFNTGKTYTVITFGLTAFVLVFLVIKKVDYLPPLFISYVLLLLPFFLVNGVLTGSFLNRTVVSYNDAYNLGIRIFTIPVEDAIYGFLLFVTTVALFEFFKLKDFNIRKLKSL